MWSAIVAQIDQPGSQSEFVSVGDSLREMFHKHPWSIGGGGAAELKEQLHSACGHVLGELIEPRLGSRRMAEEEIFFLPPNRLRAGSSPAEFRGLLIGENVRDWSDQGVDVSVWYPYTDLTEASHVPRYIWGWAAQHCQTERLLVAYFLTAAYLGTSINNIPRRHTSLPSRSSSPSSPRTTTSCSTAVARCSIGRLR